MPEGVVFTIILSFVGKGMSLFAQMKEKLYYFALAKRFS